MRPARALALATLAAGSAGAISGLYFGLVTGALTLDLGVGDASVHSGRSRWRSKHPVRWCTTSLPRRTRPVRPGRCGRR